MGQLFLAFKARRVIFLHPTRATATEGFRDYVSRAPESEASLLHGTSDYKLEGMFLDKKIRFLWEIRRGFPSYRAFWSFRKNFS